MDMGRGGEGEMYGKSNMEAYITICKRDSKGEFALWLRKLKQGLCINLEVWDGEGGSKGKGYIYTYGWFMLRFDGKEQNSEKHLFFNKKLILKIKTLNTLHKIFNSKLINPL